MSKLSENIVYYAQTLVRSFWSGIKCSFPLVVMLASILTIGAMYDIPDPSNIGLRAAVGACAGVMILASFIAIIVRGMK